MSMDMKQQGRMMAKTAIGAARLGVLPLVLMVSGCIGLGADTPDQLLTLTPAVAASPGSTASGTVREAIAVIEPAASQRLDVNRVPVQVSDTQVAYLEDAVWVEKPARLFRGLIAERIRAGGTRLVLDETDQQYAAATKLNGKLIDMGYDARSQAVVVRFEAVLNGADGRISTRRFESEVTGVAPKIGSVGPALNQAANDVAAQVAQWVG